MQNSPNDDDDSIHSDDSNISISAQKEKLDSFINMELKHSGVYRDIHFKDNLLKVDLENLYNTCQRLESQIKKKSEQLDDSYDKLSDDQKKNEAQLAEKILFLSQQFAGTTTFFCEAFDAYSYDVLKDTYGFFEVETDKMEGNFLEIAKDLSIFQQREKINYFIIKTQSIQISDLSSAVNMLFGISMKRPEIKLEEANTKLIQEIQQLQLRF